MAWLLTLAAFGLSSLAGTSDPPNLDLAIFSFLVFLLAAPFGLLDSDRCGRHPRPGDHMILATLGTVLSGLHTGVIIGLIMLPVVMERIN